MFRIKRLFSAGVHKLSCCKDRRNYCADQHGSQCTHRSWKLSVPKAGLFALHLKHLSLKMGFLSAPRLQLLKGVTSNPQ